RPAEVRRPDLLDRTHVGLDERAELRVRRGVVHEDVEPAQRVDAVPYRRLDDLGITRRSRRGRDARANLLERGRGLRELVGLAGVHAHRGARGRQRFRDRAADALRAAGDERDLAVDAQDLRRIDHRYSPVPLSERGDATAWTSRSRRMRYSSARISTS